LDASGASAKGSTLPLTSSHPAETRKEKINDDERLGSREEQFPLLDPMLTPGKNQGLHQRNGISLKNKTNGCWEGRGGGECAGKPDSSKIPRERKRIRRFFHKNWKGVRGRALVNEVGSDGMPFKLEGDILRKPRHAQKLAHREERQRTRNRMRAKRQERLYLNLKKEGSDPDKERGRVNQYLEGTSFSLFLEHHRKTRGEAFWTQSRRVIRDLNRRGSRGCHAVPPSRGARHAKGPKIDQEKRTKSESLSLVKRSRQKGVKRVSAKKNSRSSLTEEQGGRNAP